MMISVITPVYHGNKYLDNYMKMMSKAASVYAASGSDRCVEVILVNDSPDIEIEYDTKLANGFEITVVANEKNMGIHYSRVHGLEKCNGEYVVFLDQDDRISEHSFLSHVNIIGNSDISLGNGYFEINGERKSIFGNRFSQNFSSREKAYLWIRDFIVSPGQCLVKKSSIPCEWKKNILEHNGTDDYLLWLLMFDEGCDVSCNYHHVYLHRDTGENVSADEDVMFESTKELLDILKKINFTEKKFKLIKRRIYYKKVDRSDKAAFLRASVKNVDVLLVNVIYRLIWRGCLIK